MLAFTSMLALAAPTDYAALFSNWKKSFSKSYHSVTDESSAFNAWANNHETIEAHNAKGLSYRLAHNEFSDMTTEAFFAAKLGFNVAKHSQRTFSSRPLHIQDAEATLPDAVDWVSAGAVTPVKNQGSCGSCWAFSTTGAVEGAYAIASGNLVSLSEEELVQCDTTDSGCDGGLMDNAFGWIEKNGIATEAEYEYTSGGGTAGTCAGTSASAVTLGGFVDVTSNDEEALRDAVAQQPVSVAIEADTSVFQFYSSGVLDDASCGTALDHGVLLVGYGSDGGADYWKVKNSWGPTWGEDGYIRMARGVNQCGVALEPSYPTGAAAASVASA